MRQPRWLSRVVAPFLGFTAGFALFTWPAALSFRTHYFCDDWDGLQHAWNLWWVKRAVVELGFTPFYTHDLYAPDGVTLFGHSLNLFNGLLGIPLSYALSPVAIYNTIVAFAFVSTAYGMFLLALRTGASCGGALFAGAAFSFSGYHWAHATGHMNLISMEWIPIFLLSFIALLDRPGALRGALSALALLLVLMCDHYYFVFCLAIASVLLLDRIRRSGAALGLARGLAAFAACTAATSGAWVFRLAWLHAVDPFLDTHDPREYSLDLYGLLLPGASWRFREATRGYWSSLPGLPAESSVALGLALCFCAVIGWHYARRDAKLGVWGLVAALFFLFALGPELQIGGLLTGLPLPWALLEAALPMTRLAAVPIRGASMVLLAVCVLAAHGWEPLRRLLRSQTALLLFLALWSLEAWPWPIRLTRPELPEEFAALARLPRGVSFGPEFDGADVLFYQTLTRQPIATGCISRRPRSVFRRKEELDSVVAERRFAELFGPYRIRYLVAENPSDGVPRPGVKPVFVGAKRSIYVSPDDPLPAVSAP